MWSWGEGLADNKGAWGALGVSDSPVIYVLLMVTWICESVNRQRTIYKKRQFTITKCSSVSLTVILILNIIILEASQAKNNAAAAISTGWQ